MPEALRERISAALGSPLRGLKAVSGGSIAAAYMVELGDGAKLFAKHTADGSCLQEANGLQELAKANALPTPDVLHVEADLLVLSWIESGSRGREFGSQLGEGLARLHRFTRQDGIGYGFFEDNWIGATPQPNAPGEDVRFWPAFFWEFRLEHQLRSLVDKGLATAALREGMVRLSQRIESLLPETPKACLLHGDLWSGNAVTGPDGAPWLIDPAVYYGDREADLGMADWFGNFGEGFWQAYNAAYPLEPGAETRIAIYKLYHVLNHMNLFGSSYTSEALAILKQI